MSNDYTRSSRRKLKRGEWWQPAEEYTYCDAAGRGTFRVDRHVLVKGKGWNARPVINEETGKQIKKCSQFWFCFPDGLKPAHAPKLVYRLPEVLEAVKKKQTIFIAEGEPKVEALRKMGFAATCNAEGADKWTLEHSWHLWNATVVILPDNDEAGRAHADKVGRSLEGFAKSRKLLELPNLPDHGDIVDWIKHGGTKEQFEALVANAPEWKPYGPAKDGDAEPLPLFFHGDKPAEPVRWLVRNRIPEQGVGLVAGQWGTLKTFVLIDLAGASMAGGSWTGERVCRSCGVLYLAPEGAHEIPMRLAGMIEHRIVVDSAPDMFEGGDQTTNPDRMPFAWVPGCPSLLDKDALPKLLSLADAAHNRFQTEFNLDLGLICIDTVAAAAGWRDENDNAQAQLAMNTMRELGNRIGAFVIAADHFGKDANTGTRGASAKEAAADVVLATLGDRHEDGSVTDTRLVLRKMRSGPSGLTLPFAGRTVSLGKDRDGYPVTTLVIDWNVKRSDQPKRRSGRRRIVELGPILTEVMQEHAEVINGNGAGAVRAVPRETLRTAFELAFLEEKPEASKDATKMAFSRALKTAGASLTTEKINGTDYVWYTEIPF